MTTASLQIPPGPAEKYRPSHDLLEWLSDNFARYGSIFKAFIYGVDSYVVSDPSYADYVLRMNWHNYRKGQAIKRVGLLLGSGLMVSEGDLWKNQRQMIQPALHGDMLNKSLDVIVRVNGNLLEKWQVAARRQESLNVTKDVNALVLETTLALIFGNDYDTVKSAFSVLATEATRDWNFAQAFRPLGNLVVKLVQQRREEGSASSDILGALMAARDAKTGKAMSDGQLTNEVLTLVVAGYETTATTLNWIWYLLSNNSEACQEVQRELNERQLSGPLRLDDLAKFTFTRNVIQEALRLYPAGWLMTRRALADDRLGNYFVPAGTEIYISPYLIQRNPACWSEPDRFMPERFNSDGAGNRVQQAMLPFSAGPRRCIGEALARIEMQVHLMTIAGHLRLHCADGTRIQLEAGVNLRNKYDLVMHPQILAGK